MVPKMEIYQIQYFLTLADTLNFTKAAEKCGVTQPTLSRAIKNLEEELGAERGRRERRHTHLTEFGRSIRPEMERMVAQAEHILTGAAEFKKAATAQLRLGLMCTISPSFLMPIITQLNERSLWLNLELVESSGMHIVELLLAGEIDAALVGLPHYPELLHAKPIFTEQYVVAFPKMHRFEKMEMVPVAELDSEPYVERINCEYDAHYFAAFGEPDFEPQVRYKSENEHWVQAMVAAGLGCTFIPESLVLYPELLRRPLVDPSISRTISIVTVRGRRHTPPVKLLSRLCDEACRQFSD